MKLVKQQQKLTKLMVKAEECVDRETAQKIIRKSDKTHEKIFNTQMTPRTSAC